jgi:hypothetical protein
LKWIHAFDQCQIVFIKTTTKQNTHPPIIIQNECVNKNKYGTRWLKCAGCDRRYHFNCVSNIPKHITDDEFPGGCYLCDECGWWFLNGAYDSN